MVLAKGGAMDIPEVRVVEQDEVDRLISVMMIAFSVDPLMRYIFPEPHQFLNGGPFVFSEQGKTSLEAGATYVVNHYEGGAIWFPPGVEPWNNPESGMIPFVEVSRLENMVKTLQAMDEAHPKEPHWYLGFIGIDTAKQGKGLGASLLKHTLSIIDEAGDVAYLESSNPRNVPLYERYGFEVTGEIQFGDGPVVTPMVRPAKS